MAIVILVRPPTDAQPMAEMPQWLTNTPRGMMEDGAISDSPPETGIGGFQRPLARTCSLIGSWSGQSM
ncbi:hypothetical protein BKA56DRAFT_350691 [Ilyonectria sp. MPI-CAGE-AT-0026]|nr:hypothetical protein BKA56DRAFT_350691 [Ilyonectria sp. MPI-CAGE-AT-0026]